MGVHTRVGVASWAVWVFLKSGLFPYAFSSSGFRFKCLIFHSESGQSIRLFEKFIKT